MERAFPYKPEYANSWALVIGINKYKYKDEIPLLDYARNDALEIANVLRERFGFRRDHVKVLLDARANGKAIRKEFLKLTRSAPDDRVVVFFAGHGGRMRGRRGDVGFLIPVDGRRDDVHSLIRWDELTGSADQLIPAKHLFLIIDACYGGLAMKRGPSFGAMRFLEDLLCRYSRQVLTAGKGDELVADGNGVNGHSIFTSHLLDALAGAAATREGLITASGIMAYVYQNVGCDRLSDQTPQYGYLDGDGDLIFNPTVLANAGTGDRPADILIRSAPYVATVPADDPPLVQQTKDLLSDHSRIRLEDFVSTHVRRLLDATSLGNQSVRASSTELPGLLAYCEARSRELQQIVILLARWGTAEQLDLLERVLQELAEAEKDGPDTAAWLLLGWYPVLCLIYSAGIAALAGKNRVALRTVLQTPVHLAGDTHAKPLIVVAVDKLGRNDVQEGFRQLFDGEERRSAPRSEHLFRTLQPLLEDMLFLGRSYESLFDEFEILVALLYADLKSEGWGPPGRFTRKYRFDGENDPFSRIVREAMTAGKEWWALANGMFQGSTRRFENARAAIEAQMRSLP